MPSCKTLPEGKKFEAGQQVDPDDPLQHFAQPYYRYFSVFMIALMSPDFAALYSTVSNLSSDVSTALSHRAEKAHHLFSRHTQSSDQC
jgi:hypothetical protein